MVDRRRSRPGSARGPPGARLTNGRAESTCRAAERGSTSRFRRWAAAGGSISSTPACRTRWSSCPTGRSTSAASGGRCGFCAFGRGGNVDFVAAGRSGLACARTSAASDQTSPAAPASPRPRRGAGAGEGERVRVRTGRPDAASRSNDPARGPGQWSSPERSRYEIQVLRRVSDSIQTRQVDSWGRLPRVVRRQIRAGTRAWCPAARRARRRRSWRIPALPGDLHGRAAGPGLGIGITHGGPSRRPGRPWRRRPGPSTLKQPTGGPVPLPRRRQTRLPIMVYNIPGRTARQYRAGDAGAHR